MSLAIFDLDNTLIGGDSDVMWGEFLVEKGHVDPQDYKEKNQQFYLDYKNGTLDIQKYLLFALAPLTRFSNDQLQTMHAQFMTEKIHPIMLSKAYTLIERHRCSGDELLIITATNNFIAEPIAKELKINNILASNAEFVNGRYTGRSTGVPCFQKGKITRLKEWLTNKPFSISDSYFYSDSINDLPLLELVDKPFAVDPCERLRTAAVENNMPIISLRD